MSSYSAFPERHAQPDAGKLRWHNRHIVKIAPGEDIQQLVAQIQVRIEDDIEGDTKTGVQHANFSSSSPPLRLETTSITISGGLPSPQMK